MITGEMLALVANRLIPNYLKDIEWGDTWQRPLESGIAFEWTTLSALAAQSIMRGWSYSFPVFNLSEGRFLFPLRNEIPFHHGAQAGHAISTQHGQTLTNRFLQSLIPKLLIWKEDSYYSFFREGCPYHKIMTNQDYIDRPDILILFGRPSLDYPRLVKYGTEIDFSFDFNNRENITGRIRIINSATLPLISRTPQEGMIIPIAGLIECSVNKAPRVAAKQLQRYDETL